jgi:hypothetical protein
MPRKFPNKRRKGEKEKRDTSLTKDQKVKTVSGDELFNEWTVGKTTRKKR